MFNKRVVEMEHKEYPTFVYVLMIAAATVAFVAIAMAAIYYKMYAGSSYMLNGNVIDGNPHCFYSDVESSTVI